MINIEISRAEYNYQIEGIKSNFYCVDKNSINNPELFIYKNKCFINFFLEFKKGEEIAFITLQKTGNKITKEKYNYFSEKNEENIELIKDELRL